MPKCTFCGKDLPRGAGKMYVKKDGSILWFDSLKCQTNMLELNRTPAKLKWTEAYRKLKAIK